MQIDKPINLAGKDFVDNKFAYYKHLREQMPVAQAKIAVVNVKVVSRYEDCLMVVKDPRFGRNRSKITGGSRMPFPVPKSIGLLALSMIVEDDPEHRRLRALVQKAFSPKTIHNLEGQIEQLTHKLMDAALAKGAVDLQRDYALQIPSVVIASIMGVPQQRMPEFREGVRVLSSGLSGWNIFRTVFWDLRKSVKFIRELIAEKRRHPADDVITKLIEAEEEGDELSEDEIISMVFLLIVAGYETTVHLVSNGVVALLDHPEQLAGLRENPQGMGSAVEEILRFCPPVHGTKMNYAKEDLTIAGVDVAKGESVVPLLASANRDEAVFTDPDVFDVHRDPNRHLSFSQGNHFCLGAFLARMEAKIALQTLLERAPNLRLAVPRDALELQRMALWHRYTQLPVLLN